MSSLSRDEFARYSRQLRLPEIGVEGQQKLRSARVLVVGAGGLGSPAALYLAAAGVGTVGIADFDRVEVHNLHRQILHGQPSLGRSKTASASARLSDLNPEIQVVEHPEGVTPDNVLGLFRAYDVIVDGTDNFRTRYLNNDGAFLTRRPLVSGSIFKFSGQVSVFAPHLGGPCHRCLFPERPAAGTVPSCGEVGVLGAVCGVVGSFQAMEALKLLTGTGELLVGRLLVYDALAATTTTFRLPRDPHCPTCGAQTPLREINPAHYDETCPPPLPVNTSSYPLEVSVREAQAALDGSPDQVQLIDVREPHEVALVRIPGARHIPMRQIPEHLGELPRDRHLLIHCHHGGRSLRVTEYLRSHGFTAVSNVGGGIDAWATEIDPSLPRY